MAHATFSYELSQEADNDLDGIYDYTVEKFGVGQAVGYLSSFEEIFEHLCNNPKLGRKRNEVRNGLRSISNQSHTVFYRVLKDSIRIVRILHGSRDVVKFLPPKE